MSLQFTWTGCRLGAGRAAGARPRAADRCGPTRPARPGRCRFGFFFKDPAGSDEHRLGAQWDAAGGVVRGGGSAVSARVGALVELVRLPAALTVPGDTLAGAAAAGRVDRRAAVLPLASVSLYWAGMALNDWADRDLDAVERPERPIPSGRVRPGTALASPPGSPRPASGIAALAGGRRAAAHGRRPGRCRLGLRHGPQGAARPVPPRWRPPAASTSCSGPAAARARPRGPPALMAGAHRRGHPAQPRRGARHPPGHGPVGTRLRRPVATAAGGSGARTAVRCRAPLAATYADDGRPGAARRRGAPPTPPPSGAPPGPASAA